MKKKPESGFSADFPALRVLILMTGIVTAACSWYALNNWLRDDGEVTWFAPDKQCDLHQGACTARLGSAGQMTFSINVEDGIQALKALPLSVALEGVDAEQVSVDFIGREMEMGFHRFSLSRDTPGHFAGRGQLGICTQRAMPWRAKVIVDTPQGRLGSWFDFDVTRS